MNPVDLYYCEDEYLLHWLSVLCDGVEAAHRAARAEAKARGR